MAIPDRAHDQDWDNALAPDGIAAHRALKRIDIELKKPRDLVPSRLNAGSASGRRHAGLDKIQMISQDQPPGSIG
jgi:hypothetical protein